MITILQKLMLLFAAVLPLTACASDNDSDIETGTNNSLKMTINITIDGQTLSASLVENSSTAALIDRLQQGPVTYTADDYGNFEKVGDLGPEPLSVDWKGGLKLDSLCGNPLVDFLYTADPTAVEYDGRLYVYGTNDQQQCDETHPDSANTYERINSLAMMSTRDMVNWTYHGLIHTKQLAPWIIASWAPSICSRVEDDGQTHFYLYFSNSGYGTGVLTATSPVGPWSSPLDKSIVDAQTPGLGDCNVPFDPGVVIDDEGTGWLSFGAGKARLARLGKDMLSFGSPFTVLPAKRHFEANELNIIGGRMVYIYNLDWNEEPRCTMGYMLPEGDVLDTDSWKYQDIFILNPGDDGFEYSNNHTHLHKYEGKWYVFGHTLALKNAKHIKGGYRSICVENTDVDEANQQISMAHYTRQGVEQIRPINPFEQQEMETVFATLGVNFEPTDEPGNMTASADSTGVTMVRGVEFDKTPRSIDFICDGVGQIDVRLDNPDGELIASTLVDGNTSAKLMSKPQGTHDVVFVFQGKDLKIDKWVMK